MRVRQSKHRSQSRVRTYCVPEVSFGQVHISDNCDKQLKTDQIYGSISAVQRSAKGRSEIIIMITLITVQVQVSLYWTPSRIDFRACFGTILSFLAPAFFRHRARSRSENSKLFQIKFILEKASSRQAPYFIRKLLLPKCLCRSSWSNSSQVPFES